jgi:hypothetical protein
MNLQPTFQHLFPEGSFGGQCGTFAHKLVQFPSVGNTLRSKQQAVKQLAINYAECQPGDVLITKESLIFGHVAVINNDLKGSWQLTESNYHLDLRVHHTRQIAKNSPQIIGALRGKPLYSMPTQPTQFPIQIETRVILNHMPAWNSLLSKMALLQDWFTKASGGRIELIIDYVPLDLGGWNTLFYGSGPRVEAIDEAWMKANIMPLVPEAKIVLFVVSPSQYKFKVFDDPNAIEYGWEYAPAFPIKALINCDEDTRTPWYPDLDGFFDITRHEIVHGLYSICAASNFPAGTDLTHQHYLNHEFEKVFADFDYDKLYSVINN